MSRLRIKLGMFDAEGRDDRAWNWAIRFWAFVWRWTGRGYGWMRGMQPCDFCGIDAEDADYMFERVGHGKLACMTGNDCYENRLLASIPGSQTAHRRGGHQPPVGPPPTAAPSKPRDSRSAAAPNPDGAPTDE